jgi:hypothetical protein
MNCSRDVAGQQCHDYGVCSSSGLCVCVAGLQSGFDGSHYLPCCALKGDCNWLAVGLAAAALVVGVTLAGVFLALKKNIIQSTRLKQWESTIQQTLLGDQPLVQLEDPFQGQFSRPATRQDKVMAALTLTSYVVSRGLLVFTLISPSTLPNKLAHVNNFTLDGALSWAPAIVDCACGTSADLWYQQGSCAKQLSSAVEPFYYPFILDLFLLLLGWKLQKYFPLSLHNSLAPFVYGVVYNRLRTPVSSTVGKEVSTEDIITSVPDQTQPSPRAETPTQDTAPANAFAIWEKCILGWLLLPIPFANFAVPYRDFMTNIDVWAPCNGVIYGTKDVIMALMSVQAALGAMCMTIAYWWDVCGLLCCWCLCRRFCSGNRIHNLYRIGWERI